MTGRVTRGAFHVERLTIATYVEATKGLAPWESAYEAAERRIAAGPCWEAWVRGEVASVAGLAILWPGVAEAWAVITDVGRAHPVFVARHMRHRLTREIARRKLHRVQADVRAGYAEGYLLVDWLGFQEEGVMKGYGTDKADHVRYAWTEAGL